VLARRFDRVFAPLGLTNGQFSLMMALNRPHPAAMAEVAAVLALDRSTLTAALKPLARQGLVDILPDPADRRARRLALTQEGNALLARAYPVWEAEHGRLEMALGDGRPERMREDMRGVA
jgi:DNA-binding MarR family transcriptional regulator